MKTIPSQYMQWKFKKDCMSGSIMRITGMTVCTFTIYLQNLSTLSF